MLGVKIYQIQSENHPINYLNKVILNQYLRSINTIFRGLNQMNAMFLFKINL